MLSQDGKRELELTRLLHRCQALSDRVDPQRPPGRALPTEYAWQCRALHERVALLRALLRDTPSPRRVAEADPLRLERCERALAASLDYFRSIYLPPAAKAGSEPDGEPQ